MIVAAAARAALPAPIAVRLSTVALHVPALGERTAELPAIVAATLAGLAGRRGAAPPALTPDALARLAAHAWPGDVPELDAVLAHAILASGGHAIETVHLPLRSAAVQPALAPAGPPERVARLEFLLAELAHELKNPLVTIKTFADHLPALLDDAELRQRFATLTDDAIGRIDGVLENVLDFARLEPPRPVTVEVGPMLDGLLAEVAPELDERAVTLQRTGDGAVRCMSDPVHLTYALRNLLAGVVREVPPRDRLCLDAQANGVVRLGFATGTAATRLRR